MSKGDGNGSRRPQAKGGDIAFAPQQLACGTFKRSNKTVSPGQNNTEKNHIICTELNKALGIERSSRVTRHDPLDS